MNFKLLLYFIFCTLLLFAEFRVKLYRKQGKQFLDKYLVCFLLSLVFCILATFLQFGASDDSLLVLTLYAVSSIVGTFLSLIYLVCRGLFVLIEIFSPKSKKGKAQQAIEDLIDSPVKAVVFVVVLVVLSHIGIIYGLWVAWGLNG